MTGIRSYFELILWPEYLLVLHKVVNIKSTVLGTKTFQDPLSGRGVRPEPYWKGNPSCTDTFVDNGDSGVGDLSEWIGPPQCLMALTEYMFYWNIFLRVFCLLFLVLVSKSNFYNDVLPKPDPHLLTLVPLFNPSITLLGPLFTTHDLDCVTLIFTFPSLSN